MAKVVQLVNPYRNKLEEHMQAVDRQLRQSKQKAMRQSKQKTSSKQEHIDALIMLYQSVDQRYKSQYIDTMQEYIDISEPDSEKRRYFAEHLVKHQSSFFDPDNHTHIYRMKYTEYSAQMAERLMPHTLNMVLSQFSDLVFKLQDPKLSLYVDSIIRAYDTSWQYVKPLARGLTGILVNMSEKSARAYIVQGFKLLKSGTELEIAQASKWITRDTEAARNTYIQLIKS